MEKTILIFAMMLSACTPRAGEEVERVVIDGVPWATRNVGEKGAFVAHPEDYGNFYTFEEALTACPEGWRLPTQGEFEALARSDNRWAKVRGIRGRRFGRDSFAIFLPAGGDRYYGHPPGLTKPGHGGSYWSFSSAPHSYDFFRTSWRMSGHAGRHSYEQHGFNVRCVKDTAAVTLPGAESVMIDGVSWAIRNVAEKGAFAANPEDYGNHYTFEEALTACPKGWRLPTWAEVDRLKQLGHVGGSINGIPGLQFGIGYRSIFLPAAGYHSYDRLFRNRAPAASVSKTVSYWASAADGGCRRFGSDLGPDSDALDISALSVRCVKEENDKNDIK